MTARKRRRRRSAAPLIAVLALIAAAIGAFVYIYTHYNVVMGTLFEKHAALGKHIISLSGDDHSFEHLYKDGVHYVRPGCGRDANYSQQTQLKDYKYSIFYKQVSCFSTLDMSADASSITLTAYDSVGTVFYTYTFSQETWGIPFTSDNTQITPYKFLRDGTIYIRRSENTYSLVGTKVR